MAVDVPQVFTRLESRPRKLQLCNPFRVKIWGDCYLRGYTHAFHEKVIWHKVEIYVLFLSPPAMRAFFNGYWKLAKLLENVSTALLCDSVSPCRSQSLTSWTFQRTRILPGGRNQYIFSDSCVILSNFNRSADSPLVATISRVVTNGNAANLGSERFLPTVMELLFE